MAQQIINAGAAPNDGTGDPLRTSFTKCNDNFTELYQANWGNVSNSGTPAADQIAVWTDATHIKGVDASALASQTINCGRLTLVSATQLKFAPYHGDRIKIAGTIYAIPSAGIAGLTNGGLSANTTYYVYAYNNAGTITGEFSATTHATSTTAGNVGTEIKSGDNTRTLIGLVRTNASSQFQDDANFRGMLTWFNRLSRAVIGNTINNATSGAPWIELNSSGRAFFLNWGDEAVVISMVGQANNNTALGQNYSSVGLNGTTPVMPVGCLNTIPAAGYNMVIAGSHVVSPGIITESFHYITPIGGIAGGTATFNFAVSALIRG